MSAFHSTPTLPTRAKPLKRANSGQLLRTSGPKHRPGCSRPSAKPFAPGVRVQIVDGDTAFANKLSASLRTAGLQVSAVAGGKAALARMKANVPDVLLVDCTEPASRALIAACRAEPRLSGVPLILLSACDDLSRATAELGARAGLAKPIDQDVLIAVLKLVGRR